LQNKSDPFAKTGLGRTFSIRVPYKEGSTQQGGALGLRTQGPGRNDLAQTAPFYPMLGYGDIDPISSLGAADWSNYRVVATVQVVSPRPEYARNDPFLVVRKRSFLAIMYEHDRFTQTGSGKT
jgi:hypothetical protein